jgi:hypothetical protein
MKILFLETTTTGPLVNCGLEPSSIENIDYFPEIVSLGWILHDLQTGKLEEFNFKLDRSTNPNPNSNEKRTYPSPDGSVNPYGIFKVVIEYLDIADVLVSGAAIHNVNSLIADILRVTGDNIGGFVESTRIIDLITGLNELTEADTIIDIYEFLFRKKMSSLTDKTICRAVASSFFKLLSNSPYAKKLLPEGKVGSEFYDLDFTDGYKPPKPSKISPLNV